MSAEHVHHSYTACLYVSQQALCRLQGRISPAAAAQIHRMQAKQEEKAKLEAILEQVRNLIVTDLRLLAALAHLLMHLHLLTAQTHSTARETASVHYMKCGLIYCYDGLSFIVAMHACRCNRNKLNWKQGYSISSFKW